MIINISILFIIFIVIVKYSQHTTEFSLERRWKLVNFIKEVKKDSEYNEEFIRLLENMFIDSIDKNFLPKFVFNILYIKFLANKNKFIECEKEFDRKIWNVNKQREAYQKAFSIMFEINLIAAPHWYLIFVALGIIAMIFRKIYKALNNSNFGYSKQKIYAEMTLRTL